MHFHGLRIRRARSSADYPTSQPTNKDAHPGNGSQIDALSAFERFALPTHKLGASSRLEACQYHGDFERRDQNRRSRPCPTILQASALPLQRRQGRRHNLVSSARASTGKQTLHTSRRSLGRRMHLRRTTIPPANLQRRRSQNGRQKTGPVPEKPDAKDRRDPRHADQRQMARPSPPTRIPSSAEPLLLSPRNGQRSLGS